MNKEDLVKILVFWVLNKISRSLRFVILGNAFVKAGIASAPGSSGSVTCDTKLINHKVKLRMVFMSSFPITRPVA